MTDTRMIGDCARRSQHPSSHTPQLKRDCVSSGTLYRKENRLNEMRSFMSAPSFAHSLVCGSSRRSLHFPFQELLASHSLPYHNHHDSRPHRRPPASTRWPNGFSLPGDTVTTHRSAKHQDILCHCYRHFDGCRWLWRRNFARSRRETRIPQLQANQGTQRPSSSSRSSHNPSGRSQRALRRRINVVHLSWRCL